MLKLRCPSSLSLSLAAAAAAVTQLSTTFRYLTLVIYTTVVTSSSWPVHCFVLALVHFVSNRIIGNKNIHNENLRDPFFG